MLVIDTVQIVQCIAKQGLPKSLGQSDYAHAMLPWRVCPESNGEKCRACLGMLSLAAAI